MKKVTNPEQYGRLVSLMKKNADIGRGNTDRAPSDILIFWENVTTELNSLGPPQRDLKEWRKVWTDYKAFVRRKLVNNKKEVTSTCGGPNKTVYLSPVEEDVASLLSLNEIVTKVQGHSSRSILNITRKSNSSNPSESLQTPIETNINSDEVMATIQKENAEIDPNITATSETNNIRSEASGKRSRALENPTAIELVERQLKIQQNMYEQLTKTLVPIAKSSDEACSFLSKIHRAIEKSNDQQKEIILLKKQKIKEITRHNMETEKAALEKLKLKKKIVELELAKYNYQF